MINLIIPMAGRGTRLRPHTLTTPKPLTPVAGKTIVAHLIEEIQKATPAAIATIGYVLSEDPAPPLRTELTRLATQVGAQAEFYIQAQAQGTAHAIFCAAALLRGPVIVAFSDTLFQNSQPLDLTQDNAVWVQPVADPSAFGVVQTEKDGRITDFVEKPAVPVSNLAIIGIYYFRQGEVLHQYLETLIQQERHHHGEFLLTEALKDMVDNGISFFAHSVDEWFDCGNKTALLQTNQRLLDILHAKESLVASSAELHNSVLIPPVYLGEHVRLDNSVVGPHVTIGARSHVADARIANSLLQQRSTVERAVIQDSIIGNEARFSGNSAVVDLGDYTAIQQATPQSTTT